MANSRSTRWQRARSDWSGVRAKREALLALVGGVITAAVLALVGSAGAVDTLIAAGVGALVAVVLFPLAELGWCWLQAPMRLLTEDVIAIRERLEAEPAKPAAPVERPPNIRLSLLNFARMGEEAAYPISVQPVVVTTWTNEVVQFMNEHTKSEDVERVMGTGSGEGPRVTLIRRAELLRELAERY